MNDEQALHWPWLSLAISKVHEPVQATLCPWSMHLSMPAFVAEPVVALEAAESAQVRASCAKSYKVQKHQNLMFASTAGNKMHKNKFKNTSKSERKARPQKHKGQTANRHPKLQKAKGMPNIKDGIMQQESKQVYILHQILQWIGTQSRISKMHENAIQQLALKQEPATSRPVDTF